MGSSGVTGEACIYFILPSFICPRTTSATENIFLILSQEFQWKQFSPPRKYFEWLSKDPDHFFHQYQDTVCLQFLVQGLYPYPGLHYSANHQSIIYMHNSNSNQLKVIFTTQKTILIIFIINNYPVLSSSARYFLTAVLIIRKISIHSTVFIFNKKEYYINIQFCSLVLRHQCYHTAVASVNSFIITTSVLLYRKNQQLYYILFYPFPEVLLYVPCL